MLHNARKLLVIIGGSFLIGSTLAATPVSTVDIPVVDNQPEQVTPLLAQGLIKVMTRLTGNPNIAEQQAVIELLKKPDAFIENYNQQIEPPRLQIAFDQSAILQALAKAKIATWTDKKPTIMVWWLTNTDGNSRLMEDSQAHSDVLQKSADKQGFPILLPLADLDEQGLTDKAIFNAKKPTAIFTAAKKYNSNALLLVNASQLQQDKWQLQWRLWLVNHKQLLDKGIVEGQSQAEVADHLFADINPALAKLYVVKAGETKKLKVTINNVDFSNYVQISNLMSSFNGRVLETKGSVVSYEVVADPAQLKAQLELIRLYEEKATDQADKKTDQLVFKSQ